MVADLSQSLRDNPISDLHNTDLISDKIIQPTPKQCGEVLQRNESNLSGVIERNYMDSKFGSPVTARVHYPARVPQ